MSLGKSRNIPARILLLAGFLSIFSLTIFSTTGTAFAYHNLNLLIPPGSNELQDKSDNTPSPSPAPSETPNPTPSETPIVVISSTPTPSETATFTPTATHTPTATTSVTPSPIPSIAPSETPPPTSESTPFPPRTILINELAWAGTTASANDEWIELFNNSNSPVNLSGWTLTDGGDIRINLGGTIAPRGYFLLERTDNSTISDMGAHQIYRGSLRNSGEAIRLLDPSGALVDSANGNGGSWPAGESSTRKSMERRGGADQDGNWGTFTGVGGAGHDAAGNPILGTPGKKNSVLLPPPTPTTPPQQTPTPTPTPQIDSTPTPYPLRSVMINEIAWAGTFASSSDEWIELYNPGGIAIILEGWTLTDSGDIEINLSGTIPPKGFFLLERTDENTIADLEANQIYMGTLNNSGETLLLKDPSDAVVDSANSRGGAWLAGDSGSRASMEREGGADVPGNWETFTGYHGGGHDALGNPIRGSPGKSNSILQPTPAPTWIPGSIRINEVLIKPHYDWEGKGGVNTGDEFIELINIGPGTVFLKGWYLDDLPGSGSRPYKIRGFTLKPGSMMAFFNTRTHISLNDGGDTVRLLDPSGNVVDEITYLRVSAYNLSYGRLPDGSGRLMYGLWPTPNEPNILFEEPFIPDTSFPDLCPNPGQPITFLMRHARHPAQVRWMSEHGYGICD